MDRTSKQVLRYIHSYGDADNYAIRYMDDGLGEEAKKCGMPRNQFGNAIAYLVASGYMEHIYTAGGKKIGVKLTHKGVHYQEFRRRERIKFVVTSILIPALVAFITAIITALITSGWPALLQWIQQRTQ